MEELQKVGNRGYTQGFYLGNNNSESYSYDISKGLAGADFLAIVTGKENEYLKAWFKGFSNSLELISTAERQKIMCQCGKSWAEAEILSVYQQAYNASGGDLMKFADVARQNGARRILFAEKGAHTGE